MCQLMAEGVSHDFSYYLDCFPKNSERAEYSVPLETKFNEGLTCITNDHFSNIDKMYKETLYKLEQCSKGK